MPAGTRIMGEFRVDSGRTIEFYVVGSVNRSEGKKVSSNQKFDFEVSEESTVSLFLDNRASAFTPKVVDFAYQVEYPEPKAPVVPYVLTKLDVSILKSLGRMKDENRLADVMNVDVDIIVGKITQLTKTGYITANRGLTEKGYLTVNEDATGGPTIQREKEILTREIVRIPCRHCGSLVDQTATKCPSCGAPLVR